MPPRISSAARAVSEFSLDGLRVAPPEYLTDEQTGYWLEIVGAFDPDRFGLDHMPVLVALVSHMAISRRLVTELSDMGTRSLAKHGKQADVVRDIYLDLARAAREEAKIVAMLSRRLRLTPDATHTQQKADAARRAAPAAPRPWEGPPKPWEEHADANANAEPAQAKAKAN
jgi:hypothetical protein